MQMLLSGANGYALAALLVALTEPLGSPWLVVAIVALGAFAGLLLPLRSPGPWVTRVASVVWLGVLPTWGFWINSTLDPCTDACESTYQALDAPGVYVVAGSYTLALAAWVLHRWGRGEDRLRAWPSGAQGAPGERDQRRQEDAHLQRIGADGRAEPAQK